LQIIIDKMHCIMLLLNFRRNQFLKESDDRSKDLHR